MPKRQTKKILPLVAMTTIKIAILQRFQGNHTSKSLHQAQTVFNKFEQLSIRKQNIIVTNEEIIALLFNCLHIQQYSIVNIKHTD